jgi:hypothetical protein
VVTVLSENPVTGLMTISALYPNRGRKPKRLNANALTNINYRPVDLIITYISD